MSFCVKCGRDCTESLNGLCIDCWLDGRKLTHLPHHVDLDVCTNCGEFSIGNRWVAKTWDQAATDAAVDALGVLPDAKVVAVETYCENQDPYVFVVTVNCECDVLGYAAEDQSSTIVRIKNTVCTRCSRKLGSYYEAILQIRTGAKELTPEMREEVLARVEGSVLRQAAHNRSLFITKMELVTGGVDVYLSSMSLGKNLTRELSDIYCAETKESPKLVGQTSDGQDMYRITYLVRLPAYHVGDVVIHNGRHCKLLKVSGSGGKVMDLMDFRETSVRKTEMPDLRVYEAAGDLREATVINRSDGEIQVMHPDNYSTVDLRVPEGFEAGETVRIVSVDDVLYIVPRPRLYNCDCDCSLMIKLPEPIDQIVVNLLRLANTKLPKDIGWALEAAAGWETGEIARTQLGAIMENVKKAEHLSIPMCQDTGIPVFYVRGRFDSSIAGLIAKGVARATEEIPLRPNTVDPISRENTGDNLGIGMPAIHYIPTNDPFTEITVLPKGAGSENMTRLGMLNPADGMEGVMRFIVDAVLDAGGRPCPPSIVGIGIGGTSDICMSLAKEALLIPLDEENPDKELGRLEEEIFMKLNGSGLGPMGLGGQTTVLGVRAKKACCHTASLPVAVNIGCWATRRASARITDESVEYSQGVGF